MLNVISRTNGPSTKEEYENYFCELNKSYTKKDVENFIRMTIMDKRKHDDVDAIFGSYDRITFEINKTEETKEKENKDITNEHDIVNAELLKYDYRVLDYIKGTCKKSGDNREFKIGKVIDRLENFNKKIKNLFVNSKLRSATKDEYVLTLSCHPIDVLFQSTARGWTSCMAIHNSEYSNNTPNFSLREGCLIVYMHKKSDVNITKPSGRILLKPYEYLYDMKRHLFYARAAKKYGEFDTTSIDDIVEYVNGIISKDVGVISAKMVNNIYNDGEKSLIISYGNKNNLLTETFINSSHFEMKTIFDAFKEEIKNNNSDIIGKIASIIEKVKYDIDLNTPQNVIAFNEYTKDYYLKKYYYRKSYKQLFPVNNQDQLLNHVLEQIKNKDKEVNHYDRVKIAFDLIENNMPIPESLIKKTMAKTKNSYILLYLSQFMDEKYNVFQDFTNKIEDKILKNSDTYNSIFKSIKQNEKYISQEVFEKFITYLADNTGKKGGALRTLILAEAFRKNGYDISFLKNIEKIRNLKSMITFLYNKFIPEYNDIFDEDIKDYDVYKNLRTYYSYSGITKGEELLKSLYNHFTNQEQSYTFGVPTSLIQFSYRGDYYAANLSM